MSTNQLDRKLAKLGKTLAEASPRDREKLAQKFAEHVRRTSLAPSAKEALSRAYDFLRRGLAITQPEPGGALTDTIYALLSNGFPELAANLFTLLYPHLKELPDDTIIRTLPGVRSVDFWLKSAAISKKVLVGRIQREPERYFNSILMEWVIKSAPAAKLMGVVLLALRNQTRPAHLSTSTELLTQILEKDKRAAIAAAVLRETGQSLEMSDLVLRALCGARISWEAWSRAIGLEIIGRRDNQSEPAMIRAVIGLMQSGDAEMSPFASIIGSHLATTMVTAPAKPRMGDRRDVHTATATLLNNALASSRIGNPEAIWLAGPASVIADALSMGNANVTAHGARQIAQGLRALTNNADCQAIFVAVAQNLGLSLVGEAGLQVKYDPHLHEDSMGGLLPESAAVISEPGWRFQDEVILRARVIAA